MKNYDCCTYVKFGAISLKNLYFANNFWIKVRIWVRFFFTHATHIIVIILCTENFVSTKLFWVKYKFLFPFMRLLRAKSLSITWRWVSQENAFKKSKHQPPFLYRITGLNNSFKLKTISGFQDSLIWIQCNSTLWPVAKCIQLWRLDKSTCVNGCLRVHQSHTGLWNTHKMALMKFAWNIIRRCFII